MALCRTSLDLGDALVELIIADRLGQELVHSRVERSLHEAGLRVGGAAADEWLADALLVLLREESANVDSHLRPVHFWHAVVKKDQFVHRSQSFSSKPKSLLNQLERFLSSVG